MDAVAAYPTLKTRFARLTHLQDATEMLHWDLSTVMPEGGAEARAGQLATLKTLAHEMLTAPEVGDLLDRAEADPPTDPWDAANLRAMRRQWRHATALPSSLVETHARACAACEMIWRQARANDDFAAVRAPLDTVLSLTREIADARAAVLGCDPYDALLDEFEPDARAADIAPLFDRLAEVLPGILEDALAAQGSVPDAPKGPFPTDRQEALARRLMATMGFEFNHGRLDQSLHPFCGGVPDDVRITTHYHENDATNSMMSVLHETGHALYERGLPAAWRDQPVGRALGMSMHEGQSLLMEMQATRSRAFLGWAAPVMTEVLGTESNAPVWDADSLYRLYTRVAPGFIRIDADEVTYPLHIILRFRLERAMIAGDLSVTDLPGAWREGMKTLLGLDVPTDRDGCLQDIHWYDGGLGYFPTYTLGAMTAAQLFQAALTAQPTIPDALGRGDFTPLLGWLRTHVHSKGSLLTAPELLTEATGKPLDPDIFLAHLRHRYVERI